MVVSYHSELVDPENSTQPLYISSLLSIHKVANEETFAFTLYKLIMTFR